jgi:serine protease Do
LPRHYFNELSAPETIRDLQNIQEALQKALPRARNAAVGIDMGEGAGSGVIVSEDGLVLTAAHVSGGVGKELTIIMEDGTRHKATTLGLVARTDAAMMKIDEPGSYPFVELDEGDSARLGDWVFSLGHSGGFDKERGVGVRIGRLVRVAQETIQSDCNLIGGDSGGPLFDMHGRLIGIHSRVGASVEQNMHVPIREFVANWDGLQQSEFIGEGPFAQKPEIGMGFLGIGTADRAEGGVRVTEVLEESPAAKAKLLVDDVILGVDDKEIENKEGWKALMAEQAPGFKLKLKVLRDDEEIEIEVELEKR